MPYDWRNMRWRQHKVAWPDVLMDALETMGKECGHTPDEMVILLVNYAMDWLCETRRSDDVVDARDHLRLFVRQWLRHEFPEQWSEAVSRSIPPALVFGVKEGKPERKEWWDE